MTDAFENVSSLIDKGVYSQHNVRDWSGHNRADTVGASEISQCARKTVYLKHNLTQDNGSSGALADLAQTLDRIAISDTSGTWNDTTKFIPSTGCPVDGSILANWLGMHAYSWYNLAALIMLDRAGLNVTAALNHLIASRDSSTLAPDADKAFDPQFDLQEAA